MKSRIAYVADVHVGNVKMHGGPVTAGLNKRCREIVGTLRRAVIEAEKRSCTGFVVLGDLFDGTKPEPQVIAAVQQAFDTKMEVLLEMGNHDMVSTMAGDHALAPLVPVVSVAERPAVLNVGGLSHVVVPYEPGPAIDWLPKRLDELKPQGGVLALHLGLSDGNTEKWLQGAADSVPVAFLKALMDKHHIVRALAGNWHTPRDWPNITQVGTLCPTGWDNPGLNYGRMMIWDGTTLETVRIPGPRFINVKLGEDVKVQTECQMYVRVQVDDESKTYPGVAALQARGFFVEVVGDDEAVREATEAAAAAVTGMESIDQALDAYVKEMALPEAVDRAKVLETARAYLNAAG